VSPQRTPAHDVAPLVEALRQIAPGAHPGVASKSGRFCQLSAGRFFFAQPTTRKTMVAIISGSGSQPTSQSRSRSWQPRSQLSRSLAGGWGAPQSG
jgi:hypothetical protein